MKKLSLIFLIVLNLHHSKAQQIVKLWVRFEPIENDLNKEFEFPIIVDSTALNMQLQNTLFKCWDNLYLSAHFSFVDKIQDSISAKILLGNKYNVAAISAGNVPQDWFLNAGFHQSNQKLANTKTLVKRIKNILISAQNNGFPFATIQLDSVIADSSSFKASLLLEKNALILFDSLDYGGTLSIKKKFLINYTGISPGTVYNESALLNLDSRLSELPFLKVSKPMGIYFYGNKAKPYVYLDNRKASSFDGIIGFAPNSSLNNKLIITGDVNLKLQNLFGTAKSIEANYRSFLNNSQDLQFKFSWPYFLNTKIGMDYAFRLLKYDTTYLDIFNDISLQYRFAGNNYVKLFYQNQTVSLFNVDTNLIISNKSLPAFNDIKNDLYGIGLRKTKLDYYINPSKGYQIELDIGAGTKRIVRNSQIQALNIKADNGSFYKIYDSIKLQTLQYRANLNFSKYFKFQSHFVLHTQVKSAIVYAQNLFLNELFRIGGLKTLKGFDEQSIFADKYSIANIELRYLFQQNSTFMIFWNGAWYQNTVRKPLITDTPWGIGAGMNVETAAGIFSLYYAVGKQLNNPFEIRNAKIHFGFINYF